MANSEHLKILNQGIKVWNKWRHDNPNISPDLSRANLGQARLSEANLTATDLTEANLKEAQLGNVKLDHSVLTRAHLDQASLISTSLVGADLVSATLDHAFISGCGLYNANLTGATLRAAYLLWTFASYARFQNVNFLFATFNHVILHQADFTDAQFGSTVFAEADLSPVTGLETAHHKSPSSIGIGTLYQSKGKIPEVFLRGCGMPDEMIEFARSLRSSPIEFNSCFISYSTKDEEFAKRLYNDLQANGVRCWFAPHDMKGGKKIRDQIDWAIHYHDRLLLILSPDSINSEWVKREIDKARKKLMRTEMFSFPSAW